MSLLSQYMMRTILASTALVLVVLLALAGLFEFIAELDDVRGDVALADLVEVPVPRAALRIEGEEAVVVEAAEELADEEGIAAGLVAEELG